MFAFYIVRGKSKQELESLSWGEKIFYKVAMDRYYKEEEEKYKALAGRAK